MLLRIHMIIKQLLRPLKNRLANSKKVPTYEEQFVIGLHLGKDPKESALNGPESKSFVFLLTLLKHSALSERKISFHVSALFPR